MVEVLALPWFAEKLTWVFNVLISHSFNSVSDNAVGRKITEVGGMFTFYQELARQLNNRHFMANKMH